MGEFKTAQISLRCVKGDNKTGQIQSMTSGSAELLFFQFLCWFLSTFSPLDLSSRVIDFASAFLTALSRPCSICIIASLSYKCFLTISDTNSLWALILPASSSMSTSVSSWGVRLCFRPFLSARCWGPSFSALILSQSVSLKNNSSKIFQSFYMNIYIIKNTFMFLWQTLRVLQQVCFSSSLLNVTMASFSAI